MPPLPKRNPARQNKSATKATLSVVHDVKAPTLPAREDGWRTETLEWWADIWASPMAPEFDDSDRHGLFLLAVLVDEFWTSPSIALAGEIRLQRQCFGLTPIDRRRLQWEIERTEDAQDKGRQRRAPAGGSRSKKSGDEDPRASLYAVP